MENLFLNEMIPDLLESHLFINLARIDKKKSSGKNKIY